MAVGLEKLRAFPAFLQKGLDLFKRDPASNDYQRGYHACLKESAKELGMETE